MSADIASAVISASLQVLFDRINPRRELSELFRGSNHIEGMLKELKKYVITIASVVDDAEKKQFTNPAVRQWLNDLKEIVYDFEDLMDVISTEALRRKDARLWMSLSPSNLVFENGVVQKMKAMIDKVESLERHKVLLGLEEATTAESKRFQPPSTSLVYETNIIGRDEDKEAMINLLLSESVTSDQIDVIAIVGMSGIGKTTLARLVYNDYRVDEKFSFKAWINVSDDFNVFGLTKAVLEAITSQTSDAEDLYSLQVKLKNSLNMKKILLVLDDVWCRDCSLWDIMRSPLMAAAGSKIIVTTRDNSVAATMSTLPAYHLKLLSYDDSWLLFAKHAFANSESRLHPELEAIGKQIVKKFDGFPLLATTLGSMLRLKPWVKEWNVVLESNIFDLLCDRSDIISAFMRSYNSLPAHLKRCFAYCSIFHQAHEYEEETLTLLWKAEGLLPHSRHERIEEVGHKYFHDLISRSFFQPSSSNRSRFVMHSLINDLAQFVSGDFSIKLVNQGPIKVQKKVRHLSFSGDLNMEICMAICEAKSLRTVLPHKLPQDKKSRQLSGRVLKVLFEALQYLRAFSLPYYLVTELPESIGRLKHLRYLNLSHTAIVRLPDSVNYLYNLETLLLSKCRSLTKLATDMGNLINLSQLDVGGTNLQKMPAGLGKLISLRKLSNFVVGKGGGSKIRELGALSNLLGVLHISQLQNVVSAKEVFEADIRNKQELEGLVLDWSDKREDSRKERAPKEEEVLEQLQPHTNLKWLSIKSYQGISFPDWLGDSSFSKMVFLRVSNCKNCSHLPPLGQLPCLRDLIIEGRNQLKVVGLEFYGSAKQFPSLQTLIFEGMLQWEYWISPEGEGLVFPYLQQIFIRKCPNLKGSLPSFHPATKVEISECPGLEMTLPSPPVIQDLQSDDGNEVQITSNKQLVARLPIQEQQRLLDSSMVLFENDEKLVARPPKLPPREEWPLLDSNLDQFLRDDEVASLFSEQWTEISIASHSIPPKSSQYFSEAASIQDDDASQFQMPSDSETPAVGSENDDTINRSYAESLKVSRISQLMDLPTALHTLKIEGCDALKSLPEGLTGDNPHLKHLYISNCCFLEFFYGGHPPTTLKTLYIRNCKILEFLSSGETMQQYHSGETMQQYPILEDLCIQNSCDSLSSFPLAFFPKLKNLVVWDSTNFSFIWMKEDHKSLNILEIRDCPKLVSFQGGGLLTPNLKSIMLSNCKNLKALPDHLHRLTSLQSLSINECPELESIPVGGLPHNLNSLCITSCNKLTPSRDWGMHDLNSLIFLEIEGGCRDLESFPEQQLLPSNLNTLRISRFPNLKFLDHVGLEHLTSLETLEINCCKKLRSLPEECLPSSLTSLYINECILLKSELQNKSGEEWYKIAHIPHIKIDSEEIS